MLSIPWLFHGWTSRCGAGGCKLLNANGSIQRSIKQLVPSIIILYGSTILGKLPFFKEKLKNYYIRSLWFDKVEEVDGASRTALLVRGSIR